MLPDDSSSPPDGGGGGENGGVEERQRRAWAGRRALLDRAISMTAAEPGVYPEDGSAAAAAARLNRTSSPATKARWRHARSTRSTRLTLLRSQAFNSDDDDEKKAPGDRLQLGPSPPVDDDLAPLFESFERAVPEELRVRICRDGVAQALQEATRAAAGSTALLDAIERGDLTADSALDALAGKPALELHLALLWAALQRRRDLLPALLKAGASLDFCDADGFSALHLAAFSGCADSCRFLVSMGADVNLMRGPFSPLHSAAFGNALDATRVLLDAGAVVEYWKRNGGRAGDASALHSAVKANAVDVLRLLLGRCEDVNSVAPAGCAPLHLAADLGKLDCLRALAEWEGVDLNVQTTEKCATALHLAAENGLGECVALLLARGADANVRNYRGQVPLHLAARAQSVECVETLLRASSCDVNVADDDLRTPLHAAVGKALQAYEVAETLIAWRADVNACDCFGYTPLHVAALNELAQCVETLLYHGADVSARTHGGTTALSIIVRKTPASLNTLYAKFDAAISMHDPEVSHREVELKLDFRQLLQHSERGEIAYLKTFVDEGQKEVLKHPLCEAFLHLKWQKIRKFYVIKLVFCFLFVLFLTLYVMSALAHNCFNEHWNSTTAIPDANSGSDPLVGSNLATDELMKSDNQSRLLCTNSTLGNFFRDHPIIIKVEWYILLFFTFCEIFRKIVGFSGFSTIKEYISQVENILEWFVVISVFTISCVFTNRIYEWQNHIGAFAVLFGWWNLMHMLGQLPLLGSYVAMYTRVQHEFLKLFAAYLCLLIGFTISFCVIFPAKKQFANPFISFMKVLVMMTGELEFDNIFFDDNPTALTYSAHFIFIIFLLFATVVLMNLLVGIAVHDIQGLQKTAGLLKLEQQTRLISYVELALFNKYIPRFMLRCLQRKASVSPSAYRVVLHVKPLNPREKRLPRSILITAYELAKQRKHNKKHGTIASRFSSVTASTYTGIAASTFSDGTLYSRSSANMENLCTGVEGSNKAVAKLSDEVTELRGIVESQQNMLKELLELVKKQKESDC